MATVSLPVKSKLDSCYLVSSIIAVLVAGGCVNVFKETAEDSVNQTMWYTGLVHIMYMVMYWARGGLFLYITVQIVLIARVQMTRGSLADLCSLSRTSCPRHTLHRRYALRKSISLIIASETRNYINYWDSLSELRHLHKRTATMAVQLPLLLVRAFGNILFLRKTVSLA